MDMCLLCLELRHESVECIYVGSQQWEENNIALLIEQHFWPIESITSDSWLCSPCWYILNEFHKFFIRIEEAHEDLALTMQTMRCSPLVKETKPPSSSQLQDNLNDFEELIDKDLIKNVESFNIESITSDSWLCSPCWYILNEFHKFFIRIEEAHEDLALTMQTMRCSPLVKETKPPSSSQLQDNLNDFEELIDKDLIKNVESFNIVININELEKALWREQQQTTQHELHSYATEQQELTKNEDAGPTTEFTANHNESYHVSEETVTDAADGVVVVNQEQTTLEDNSQHIPDVILVQVPANVSVEQDMDMDQGQVNRFSEYQLEASQIIQYHDGGQDIIADYSGGGEDNIQHVPANFSAEQDMDQGQIHTFSEHQLEASKIMQYHDEGLCNIADCNGGDEDVHEDNIQHAPENISVEQYMEHGEIYSFSEHQFQSGQILQDHDEGQDNITDYNGGNYNNVNQEKITLEDNIQHVPDVISLVEVPANISVEHDMQHVQVYRFSEHHLEPGEIIQNHDSGQDNVADYSQEQITLEDNIQCVPEVSLGQVPVNMSEKDLVYRFSEHHLEDSQNVEDHDNVADYSKQITLEDNYQHLPNPTCSSSHMPSNTSVEHNMDQEHQDNYQHLPNPTCRRQMPSNTSVEHNMDHQHHVPEYRFSDDQLEDSQTTHDHESYQNQQETNDNEISCTDEEPITDDEEFPKFHRDPLKGNLFTKVKRIPKIFVRDEYIPPNREREQVCENTSISAEMEQSSRVISEEKCGKISKTPQESEEACNKNKRKHKECEEDDIPYNTRNRRSKTTNNKLQNNSRTILASSHKVKEHSSKELPRENATAMSENAPEVKIHRASSEANSEENTPRDSAEEVVEENSPLDPMEGITNSESFGHDNSTISKRQQTPTDTVTESESYSTDTTDNTYSQTSHSERTISTNDYETLEVGVEVTDMLDYRTETNSDYQSGNESSSALNKCKSRLTPNEYDDFLNKHFKLLCDICQEELKTFNELRRHFAKAHNKKSGVYVCCCNKKFMRRGPLVEHIQWHCDPNTYSCKYCGRQLANSHSLWNHEKNVHEKSNKEHTCDICGKSFATHNVLKNHKMIHLSDEEKQFQCDECEKKFGSNTLLLNHIRSVHMGQYMKICDICGMKLRCRDVFERHMLTHKGIPARTISCDICGSKVTHERALKRHKLLNHPEGGKVQYECHLCPRISDNLIAHRRHIKYNHEEGNTFKCIQCHKEFKTRQKIKEHMAIHTDTFLYTCPYCPKQFNSNANLHTHRKKDHPLEWLQARREKYSGKLPPNYIPSPTLARDITPETEEANQLQNA